MTYAVFSPSTGEIRLFDSYNHAQDLFPNAKISKDGSRADRDAYEALFDRHYSSFKSVGTEGVTTSDGRTHPTPTALEEQAILHPDAPTEAFWDLAHSVGDRPKASAKRDGGRKRNVNYHVSLTAAKAFIQDHHPEQAKGICKFFVEQGFDYYTHEEIIEEVQKVAFLKHVHTAQDPWRIFRYYRPLLKENGVIS